MQFSGFGIVARHADPVRQIHASWNGGLIAASIAISLLGAFTTTQLICQAKVSRGLVAVATWTLLASLTFGFCSIWSLHAVAMMAWELDLPVELDPSMTSLSAVLAVTFTFLAISDIIWDRYRSSKRPRTRHVTEDGRASFSAKTPVVQHRESEEHLLSDRASFDSDRAEHISVSHIEVTSTRSYDLQDGRRPALTRLLSGNPELSTTNLQNLQSLVTYGRVSVDSDRSEVESFTQLEMPTSQRTSSTFDSDRALLGLTGSISIRKAAASMSAAGNPFTAIAKALWAGLTVRNVSRGFIWSLAITCMHYIGICSLNVPGGSFRLRPVLVVLSAIISWVVCSVGCILMPSMETNMGQQLLFSAVASGGVAAMHYTGMAALQFFTTLPPSVHRGYPASIPIAISSIAIITCLAANALLAHSATLARNKLAEIVRTRKKLWAAIAQKQNAEAAALARSEFIASASHEIRTPLHQLQGYADLMARCALPGDAQLLLFAIQDATKTLSLITNNVLDWSRLEKGEAAIRPTQLDVRGVCDSIVKLLPRRDEDMDVELLTVVAPSVPVTIFVDETYLQRIVMNLVSNAIKFTTTGHVSLFISLEDDKLVITVEDSGIGIPKSFLRHLFEPFKQAQTRGAAHGTGLGLSIVKQLLEKVHGTIEVHSVHRDDIVHSPDRHGSKFTVTMPVCVENDAVSPIQVETSTLVGKKLAHLGPVHPRFLESFTEAWKTFNVDVTCFERLEDVTVDHDYLWVDCTSLKSETGLAQAIVKRPEMMILVPCDTDRSLDGIFDAQCSPRLVAIRRPLVFHQINQAIDALAAGQGKLEPAVRVVRFSSNVDIVSAPDDELPSPPIPSIVPLADRTATQATKTTKADTADVTGKDETMTVLLVEDNKINQKLGAKMLTVLGYKVMLAGDGQEAVDMLLDEEKARQIDMILMDQSMPRKDGLTATKEIRSLEECGTVQSSQKWVGHATRDRRRPILAVTAVVGPNHEAMCKMVGTDAFLAKPLSLKRLKESLDVFVQEMNETA